MDRFFFCILTVRNVSLTMKKKWALISNYYLLLDFLVSCLIVFMNFLCVTPRFHFSEWSLTAFNFVFRMFLWLTLQFL